MDPPAVSHGKTWEVRAEGAPEQAQHSPQEPFLLSGPAAAWKCFSLRQRRPKGKMVLEPERHLQHQKNRVAFPLPHHCMCHFIHGGWIQQRVKLPPGAMLKDSLNSNGLDLRRL